jgi:hypothetical protein
MAARARPGLRREEQRLRRHAAVPTQLRDHAPVDRGCGLAVELLVNDRAQKRAKNIDPGGGLDGAWSDAGDDFGEDGVCGGKRAGGGAVIDGQRHGLGYHEMDARLRPERKFAAS